MKRGLLWVGAAATVLGAAWLGGRMAYPLPATRGRKREAALPFDPETRLGPAAGEAAAAHPGLSGIVALADGGDALRSRLDLIALAERSIDAQYYIWHQDDSGMLLIDALRAAATRGVRVRLLLDDNGIESGMDPLLGALDAIPGFEVRIFNPSTIRRPKVAGYLLNPVRINRRMHNKALIVDGAAAIVGGRNIGDEYFSMGEGLDYLDLDVLGVGQVVADTAAVFDAYWNARAAIGIAQLRRAAAPDPAALDAEVSHARASARAAALRARAATDAPEPLDRTLEWTRVEVLADPPEKALGDSPNDKFMFSRLREVLLTTRRSLDIISAYFVPGIQGSRTLERLEATGRRVRIMTNSWRATDVPLVHAGYTKRRRDLLRVGVELYELLPTGGAPRGRKELKPLRLSRTALHAKTFGIDDRMLFVGSFNFDPRSVALNCEMGFLIESPALTRTASAAFDGGRSLHSLRPALTRRGVVWREPQTDGSVVVHRREPGSSPGSRLLTGLLARLPIEWLL